MHTGISARALVFVTVWGAVTGWAVPDACAQLQRGANRDLTRRPGDESECSIAANPLSPGELFAVCYQDGSPGFAAARTDDGGDTWVSPNAGGTIADGVDGHGPAAYSDPSVAWDGFGNLFVAYIGREGSIITILSTDRGATFTTVASFDGSVDQPTLVASSTAPGALWMVWNESGHMVASNAIVTGPGSVSSFSPPVTVPGTEQCSFGDVAVAPGGAVVQTCQHPVGGESDGIIFVSIDPDGPGPHTFSPPIQATTTNVGGFDYIPAQSSRGIDAEAGLAFDNDPASPHFGRLYLVYTDEAGDETDDTEIMLRYSDDNGATWSAPVRVNDDPPDSRRSQFLPRVATSPTTGNIAVCWYDARNSPQNLRVELFCTMASSADSAPSFGANVVVSGGSSTSHPSRIEFGDYIGLVYSGDAFHPIWADASNSTRDNPENTNGFDALSVGVIRDTAAGVAVRRPDAAPEPPRRTTPSVRSDASPCYVVPDTEQPVQASAYPVPRRMQ